MINDDWSAKVFSYIATLGGALSLSIGFAVTAKYCVDSVILAKILVISSGILGCGSALVVLLGLHTLIAILENLTETIEIQDKTLLLKETMCHRIASEVERQEKADLIRDGNAKFS